MRRGRVAALTAGGDSAGFHAVAELDDGDEAVAARAVPALAALEGPRPERGERAPARRGEAHGQARRCVAERVHDRRADALEAVDLAPRRAPAAEVLLEPCRRRGEG